ncbi:hypothetical protein HY030_04470 [Candidatus Gottesmanbacteria bacterium]|nr:hypothetical protein [Candidatus Gottesmanbacteria bacterium]
MKNQNLSKEFEQKLFSLLETKADEVAFVAPQNMGSLTIWYKKMTAPLKSAPWKIFLPLSFVIALFMELLLGRWSLKIVSVLQSAF